MQTIECKLHIFINRAIKVFHKAEHLQKNLWIHLVKSIANNQVSNPKIAIDYLYNSIYSKKIIEKLKISQQPELNPQNLKFMIGKLNKEISGIDTLLFKSVIKDSAKKSF